MLKTMAENIASIPEYSVNKKKYLQLFYALCRNSKEAKKTLPNFDESLISKKITQLEDKNLQSSKDFDWIHKKIAEKPDVSKLEKKVVVVRTKISKSDEKNNKKAIQEIKAHIIEAKKHYLDLKNKGVPKEHLESFKKRIDDLEKKLK